MPEIVKILTDDHGNITHLIDENDDRLGVNELAESIEEDAENYYVTFGEDVQFPITMIAEEGRLEPSIDDPKGGHSIWDLPQAEDPEEDEIVEMFDEMARMGEFDEDGFGGSIHETDINELK